MDYSAWILLGLTFVVTIVLLPQIAKSRRMMGESRNEDRFSHNLRVLNVEQSSQRPRDVEVLIHANTKGESMDSSMTRPIKMAQILREYTDAKANRAAASANRKMAARRRMALAMFMMVSAAVLAGLAVIGVLSWWFLSIPVVGVLSTFIWGAIASKKGKTQDLEFLKQIRQAQRSLEKTPAGRAALHAGRRRSRNHWARVAQESLEGKSLGEDTLAESIAHKAAQLATQKAEKHANTLLQDKLEQAQHGESLISVPGAESDDSVSLAVGQRNERVAGSEKTEDSALQKTKWKPNVIPAPTYTLRAPAPRREVKPVEDPEYEVSSRVPMRPQVAQYLPAGLALSSEEVRASEPLDLQSILERRRASGS